MIPVQINGKTRFRIEVPADAGEEQTIQILNAASGAGRHLGGAAIGRLVVVPGRIVNVVTR